MRKFIKKSAVIIATAAFVASFGVTVSAASAETSATEITTTSVVTENTDTTTTTVPDTVYAPLTEANISDEIDLSSVTINGIEINISDTTLSALLETANIAYCPVGATSLASDNYNFVSGMFGIQSVENDISSFNGTMVSIEVVDEKNNVISSNALDEGKFDTYKVVGVHTSVFFTHEDFDVVYYGGIKTGMTKEDLIAALGDGIVINDEIIYKNSNNTMIIEIEAGNINEITLLNNVTVNPPVNEEEWLDSPYADGMLADDDLYNYVMDYLDEGVNLDTQGTGVLIGESVINKETDENGEATKTQEFTSGEKVMYSVATRDGSIFYIIIDKGANGENVYFLNSVDIVDLASLINKEDENMSAQEKAILNEANSVTGSYNNTEEVSGDENAGSGANRNNNSSNNNSGGTVNTSKNNNTLYIVLGIGAVVAIGIGWYFKVGPGKKKNVGFDEDDDDEEEEEEYYEEEAEEDTEVPAEEAYEEEDNM